MWLPNFHSGESPRASTFSQKKNKSSQSCTDVKITSSPPPAHRKLFDKSFSESNISLKLISRRVCLSLSLSFHSFSLFFGPLLLWNNVESYDAIWVEKNKRYFTSVDEERLITIYRSQIEPNEYIVRVITPPPFLLHRCFSATTVT